MKRYPEKIEELLEDKRYLTVQRYLRRIYSDPMTGKPEWAIVAAPGGGIMGVYSNATMKPIRTLAVTQHDNTPLNAATYRDWRFTYEPPGSGQSRPRP